VGGRVRAGSHLVRSTLQPPGTWGWPRPRTLQHRGGNFWPARAGRGGGVGGRGGRGPEPARRPRLDAAGHAARGANAGEEAGRVILAAWSRAAYLTSLK